MKPLDLWRFIAEELRENRPLILAGVAEYEKGSPGKTGFKMAVSTDGLAGTIGGGIMEHRIILESREMLQRDVSQPWLKRLVHRPKSTGGELSGLICAGSQTIFAMPISRADESTVAGALSALEQQSPARLVFTSRGLAIQQGRGATHQLFVQANDAEWRFEENLGHQHTAYVIGGGHVGQAVARILQSLDFELLLIDSRSAAPAIADPSLSVRKIVCPYDAIAAHITGGEDGFAIIVTAAMISDLAALKQLAGKRLGYIGLMGTPAKITRIMNGLSTGEKHNLGAVHAPIGIGIESWTAEEIAISIAAEIVDIKNKRRC